ncbi:MAG TPA: prepilin-type N-terminal cleavage/methylation domain-containing protein, partial [Candidatus Methylacidiphilales bacterium]
MRSFFPLPPLPLRAPRRRPGEARGFSLVEVVTALGLSAICLLTLLGLLSIGIRSDKTTVQQSIAANIAGAALSDLRSAPLSTPSYAPGAVLYSPRFRFKLPAPATA